MELFYAKLFNTGNFALGTNPTDAGYKLDVNGTARVKGSGATSATSAFTVQNSGGTNGLNVQDDGKVTVGRTAGAYIEVGSLSNFYNTSVGYNHVFRVGGGEVVRIDGFGNVGIGTSTVPAKLNVTGSITAASALAQGVYFNNTLVAAVNNDVLVGLDIQPAFTNGAFTGVSNVALRVKGAGATSATTALLVQNSTPADIFTIANDGSALFDLITSGSAVVIRRKATPTSRLIEFLSSGGARFYTYDGEAAPNANGDDGAWLFRGRHRRASNNGIASAF